MAVTEHILGMKPASIIHQCAFDVIKMVGDESVDFLQRITTNDFSGFCEGKIQKTLLITDRGRVFDAVWIIHRNDHFLILASKGMAAEIISWLNKYIIMEDIRLSEVTSEYEIDLHFNGSGNYYHSDYFGFPVSFEVKQQSAILSIDVDGIDELWRIENGIPKSKNELIQDFNPLELNLWNWISFTKGCYIGQEIIARLDTYNKIQRTLCKFSTSGRVNEKDILLDDNGSDIGKITSVFLTDGKFIGLAVVRVKFAVEQQKLRIKDSNIIVEITKVFQKELHE